MKLLPLFSVANEKLKGTLGTRCECHTKPNHLIRISLCQHPTNISHILIGFASPNLHLFKYYKFDMKK
jgi:hypothetical protein